MRYCELCGVKLGLLTRHTVVITTPVRDNGPLDSIGPVALCEPCSVIMQRRNKRLNLPDED